MKPDIFGAVEQFNRAVLSLPIPSEPTRLSPARKEWALTAMEEELTEFRDATDIVEEADALMDLMYFAAGRFVEMGIDPRPVLAEVQRANMDKKKGSLSKRPNSMGFDAVKPEGWRPPVHQLSPLPPLPKLLVLGHAQHGKDTVCEMLRDLYGFRFMSSSAFCAQEIVFPKMREKYATAEECFEDRVNHRQFWKDTIADYLKDDEAKLGKTIFADNDIYCGIRRLSEFDAVCNEGLVDHVIWVEAGGRMDYEPTCEVRAEDADLFIGNNADIATLRKQVISTAEHIFRGR